MKLNGMNSTYQTDSRSVNRVGAACIQCRSRHVKCDATTPTCNRCKRDGKECVYTKSRRGGLDKAALAQRRLALQQAQESCQLMATIQPSQSRGSPSRGEANEQDEISIDYSTFLTDVPTSSNQLMFSVSSSRLLDIYYEFFHNAHPFVLPRHFISQRSPASSPILEALLAVMQFIGAIYAPWTTSDIYRTRAEKALFGSMLEETGFHVQALLLYSIAQHYSDRWLQAHKALDAATRMALCIGMNFQEFASRYGEGNPVLEESWRRTYWMLFITDQHFAIVRNSIDYTLRDVITTVELPCEESEYQSGNIPQPATLQQYEARDLADVEIVFSSFTYLIDAVRTVRFFLQKFTETGGLSEGLVLAAEPKVVSWNLLLPTCKKDPLGPDGKVDELLFLAHLIICIAGIILHRPFSSLSYSVEELYPQTFPPAPINAILPPKHPRQGSHTVKALKATEKLTQLLAVPSPPILHSPMAISVVAGITSAQVAACKVFLDDKPLAVARDRIRLSIGTLKAHAEIWPLSHKTLREVRVIARETLSTPQVNQPQHVNPSEIETLHDEFSRSIDPAPQIDIFNALEIPSPSMDWPGVSDLSNPSDTI